MLTDPPPGEARLINGRYRVLEELGRGGQGLVLKVADGAEAGRLKVVKAPLRTADPETLERLRWEFVRLARLDHARLVRVHDLEVVEPGSAVLPPGQVFFTAELCPGMHPAEWIARLGRKKLSELLWRIATDVASALDHLHGRGLLHGDVKPENLLCTAEGDVKLIDLGLSTLRGSLPGDAVAGTLEHLAPEALAGLADERSDLYSLGSTLFTLAAGRPPRLAPVGGDPSARIRVLLEADTPPLGSLVERLPEGLCAIVDSLCARRPADRPQSAQVLLEQIGRRRRAFSLALSEGQGGLELLASAPVGQEALSEELRQVIGARLALGADPSGAPALILVRGAPGSGRRTLLAEVTRTLQVAAASGQMIPFRLARGASLGEALAPVIGTAAAGLAADDGALLSLLGHLEAVVAERGLVLVVEEGDRDREVLERFFTLASRDPELRLGRLALAARVSQGSELGTSGIALARDVPALETAEVAQVLHQALGAPAVPSVVQAFHDASHGLPERLHALLRAALRQAGDRRRVAEVDLGLLSDASLTALAAGSLAGLSAEARRIGLAAAVAEEPLLVTWAAPLSDLGVAETWAAVEGLAREGLATLAQGRIHLVSLSVAQAFLEGAQGTADVERLHRALADRYRLLADAGDEAALAARIRHLAAAPPSEELPALAEQAAAKAAARSEWRRAADLLGLALEAGPLEDRERLALALAEAKVRGGDYATGLVELGTLSRRVGPAQALRVVTLQGLAHQRLGELQEARLLLEEGLTNAEAVEGAGLAGVTEARAVLGRVRLAQGDIEGARGLCPALDEAPPGAAGVPLLEVGGLAAYYAGSLDAALGFFEEASLRARRAGDEERLARAEGCLGMVAQALGDLAGGAAHFQEAWRLAEARGDVHGGAHFAANLGAVKREQGDLGGALLPSVTAVRRMVQLGHTAELPLAVYNLGNLLLGLGELAGVARELGLLETEAGHGRAPMAGGYLRLLAAELQQRLTKEGRPAPRELPRSLRRPGSALAAEAADRFAGAGASREAFYARITELECLSAEGRLEEARARLEAVRGDIGSVGDAMAVHWLALAEARFFQASPSESLESRDLELPRARLAAAQEAFEVGGLAEPSWRAALGLAELALRAGLEEEARSRVIGAAALARAQMERVPESYRGQRERDPDAVALARLERRFAPGGRSGDSGRVTRRQGPVEGEPRPLRRLLEINKRLNQELRLPILLELVLDAVLELTDGERGFILLMNEREELEVRFARNLDRRTLEPGERSLSRSIAEGVAARGEALLTVDAAQDERFSSAVSVHGLRLRSVLAVPLRVRGRVVGTLYVDNRLRRGAFSEGDLALVEDFAQQAAIALENARLHEELLAQRAEIERLNEELASRLERREAELAGVRTELRQSQAALRARYDYSNIVGQTPGMQELFRLLDRITDVDLPVVIHGESGTGKELVARAIHYNGHRKDRPFVSENCGAVPETLLESILFGHAKGAFTGADRDRRGLFEVADGGTLFLDEVGEMSPAMQTKLLRVLQEGEVRPVGGDRMVRVNVRILAASAQRLDALVAERRMRQDLYYRLNVLAVTLPPLRERREDIPLLVAHFVKKHSPDRPRRILGPALERLMAHAWPGNVRELENELQRVLALGGDVIGEADLSSALRGAGPGPKDPDDLTLRAHVERLERQLLVQALEQTSGNQTKAAELLGLSRFGLLKKLRRYALLPRAGSG